MELALLAVGLIGIFLLLGIVRKAMNTWYWCGVCQKYYNGLGWKRDTAPKTGTSELIICRECEDL